MEMKLTIEQLRNYLGTGLKLFLKEDWHSEDWTKGKIGTLDQLSLSIYKEKWFYIGIEHDENSHSNYENNQFKPLCYRLSDLDKFIPELGFVPLDELRKIDPIHNEVEIKSLEDIGIKYQQTSASDYLDLISKLFQWHFWPFGDEYFEAGLVIDKLTYGN